MIHNLPDCSCRPAEHYRCLTLLLVSLVENGYEGLATGGIYLMIISKQMVHVRLGVHTNDKVQSL